MPRRVLLAVLALALALLVAEGALSFRGGLTLRDVPGLAAWLPARAPAPRGSRRIVAAPSALATPATLPPGMPAPGMPAPGMPAPGTLETPATPRDDLSADGDPPAEADLPALHEPATDADRHAAGAASTGIYRMHEDSRVRYVLKPETTVDIVETHVRTDRLGMRVRPGPEPPPEALRIAVAGDSVAFSYGVADDETMAARLAALLAESRGPAARPVTASTVAVPSWNHRSALGFLTDHWDELRPDIVVYLPIDNDLGDGGALYESGKLRIEPDPFQSDPLLAVSRSLLAAMQDNVELRADKDVPDVTFFGPCALELDLTPESTRRYDDNARSIAAMADLCARHGARLLVVQTSHALYSVFLDERLQRVAPELPVLHLDGYLPPPFTLGIDPHANAATCDVRARWIAADLLERGWIDRGAGGELPAVPPAYAALLPPDRTPEQVLAEAAQARERVPAALLTEIDLRSGRGMRQVIGGVNLDMTLRMHALFALRAGGPVLRVELDPLPDRPDLYPLEVGVEVGGLGAGSITVQAAQRAVKDFALPDAVRPGTPFEVKLLPATWCVQTVRGRSQVVCLASARLSCPPPP